MLVAQRFDLCLFKVADLRACLHVCLHCLQDDASLDLNAFRERFGDVPQKSELTLLCPLKEDPTEKVRSSSNSPPAQTQSLQW